MATLKSQRKYHDTTSKTEKGLKHLRLVGVGREYIEKRLAEIQAAKPQKISQSKTSYQTNGKQVKK